MPKNIDDVIVPERKRSIRDIPIPDGRKKYATKSHHASSKKKEDAVDDIIADDVVPPPPPMRGPSLNIDMPRRPSRKKMWLVSGLALIVIIFALLSVFNGATLSYVPKSVSVSFNDAQYTADKSDAEGLTYSVVKISKEDGVVVPASGETTVERKASGTIIVYNTTKSNHRLIENTRFQTPEGLIYRVQDAIVVPKAGSQPGTLEVEVYADEASDDYNIGLTDFTVPGLEGTSLEGDIYARSKTTMSGGFIGVEKVVSEADQISARNSLRQVLREDLLGDAESQAPEGFAIIPTLSTITFEDLPQTTSGDDGKAILNMRGTLSAVMFKVSDLSRTLVEEDVALSNTDVVEVKDVSTLNISFDGAAPTDLTSTDSIDFIVSGSSDLVWQTDETALRADLVGRHKGDLSSVLSNYPTISSATMTNRPFWKRSFPNEASDIVIRELPVE